MKYVTGAITKYEGMESSAKTNCFQEIAHTSPKCCVSGDVEKKLPKHVDMWFNNVYVYRERTLHRIQCDQVCRGLLFVDIM